MTIRFVNPARNLDPTAVATARIAATMLPANDNDLGAAKDGGDDAILSEALRFFARHGLCAAGRAREEAVAARKAGDCDSYAWWLEICRMLDRRLADKVANEVSLGS